MAASLETNKALAALLTAGIIASGSGVISRILYHPSMPEENAYVIEVAEVETGDGEAAEAAAPLPVLLATASPEEGEGVARKCAACHSFEQGGENKIGPALWGVVGRDIAAAEGFTYSDALLAKEGEWTLEGLNAFIQNPRGWAPGTKMAFAGIQNPEELADVLVYLNSLAEEPAPLPEPSAEEAAAAAEEAAPAAEADQQTAALEEAAPEGGAPAGAGDGVGALLAQADVDTGATSAKKCMACHSFEEGGPAKIGPPLWDVVGRDIAALEDFAYSDALAGKEGAWDYQALDDFLAQPREWAPGTKMAFAGVKKPEERADIILSLRSLSTDPVPLP